MNMGGNRDGKNNSQGTPGTKDSFSPSVYCIWCEVSDHSSQKCHNRQYTFDDKKRQAKNITHASAVFKLLIIPTTIVLKKEGVTFAVQQDLRVNPYTTVISFIQGPNSKSTSKILLETTGEDIELVQEELLERNDYKIMKK